MNEDARRKRKDKVLTLRIDAELLAQIEAESEARDLSQAHVVRDALRAWVEARKAKPKKEG
jgi:hypothetical protein